MPGVWDFGFWEHELRPQTRVLTGGGRDGGSFGIFRPPSNPRSPPASDRPPPPPRPWSVCLGFKSAFATRESNAISIEYGADLENGFTYSIACASRKFPSQAHVRPRRCNRPSIHSTSAASKAATHSRTEEEGRKEASLNEGETAARPPRPPSSSAAAGERAAPV